MFFFPEELKFGVIYPMHNRDSKMTRCKYKLISVLLILNKILEKLCIKDCFNTETNLTYHINTKLDFRKSTEHAILDLHTRIVNKLKRKT